MMELEEELDEEGEKGCIFCEIAAHRESADIFYEDLLTMAFMDIHPASNGHSLVIPKKHFRTIFDIDEQNLEAVARTAREVAIAAKKALKCDGLNIIQSNGRAGSQEIFHFHVHVIPRWADDGLFVAWARKAGDIDIIRKSAQRMRREIQKFDWKA